MSNTLATIPKSRRAELKKMRDVESEMTPALRAQAQKILDMLAAAVKDSLQRIWDIGGIYQDVATNEPKYGKDALEQLSIVVKDQYSPEFLRQSAHFHRDFDAKQLKAVLGMRMKFTDRPVNWNHIQPLLAIDDKKVRETILKKTCENDWTSGEVQTACDKARGRTASQRQSGGRPITIPPTVSGRLANLAKIGGFWIRNTGSIYTDSTVGFLKSFTDLPADKVTPELIESLNGALKVAAQVEENAVLARKELEDAIKIAEERAASHAKEKAEQATKDIDAKNEEPKRLEDKGDKTSRNGTTRKRGAQAPVGSTS